MGEVAGERVGLQAGLEVTEAARGHEGGELSEEEKGYNRGGYLIKYPSVMRSRTRKKGSVWGEES